jgi:hypothetical protein
MNLIMILLIATAVALLGVALITARYNWQQIASAPHFRWRRKYGVRVMQRIRIRPPAFLKWCFRPVAIALSILSGAANWVCGAPPEIALANAEEGTHGDGKLSKKTDAAHATRHLLVKKGTDDDHIAIAGAGDTLTIYGVCTDEAAAAEELVSVTCLSGSQGTIKLVTNGAGALVVGDYVVPAANGKVAKAGVAVGNQFIVGQVLQAPATVDGTPFEARPIGAFMNTAVS